MDFPVDPEEQIDNLNLSSFTWDNWDSFNATRLDNDEKSIKNLSKSEDSDSGDHTQSNCSQSHSELELESEDEEFSEGSNSHIPKIGTSEIQNRMDFQLPVNDKSCFSYTLKCDNKINLEINKDWGKRTPLYSVINVSENERIWNKIHRGIFAEIQLECNQYGHIICKAVGKVTSNESKEKCIIEVNNQENLRKILGLSQVQWASLCEAVQESRSKLYFDAFEDFSLENATSLMKLWFFICKRRHLLSNVCVLVNLCGAVKLIREFQVVPKLIVVDVRDFKGCVIV